MSDSHGEKHDTNELDNWESRKLEGGEEKSTWLENKRYKKQKEQKFMTEKISYYSFFFLRAIFPSATEMQFSKGKNLRRLRSRTYLKNEIIVKALKNLTI